MKTKLLNPSENYSEETYSEFENRYVGFGKEIYLKIKEKTPDVFHKLTFYKQIDSQTEDSYAEYSDINQLFAIQLDPTCEVIVLWNEQKQVEIGIWSNNEYGDAIDFIKSEFLK